MNRSLMHHASHCTNLNLYHVAATRRIFRVANRTMSQLFHPIEEETTPGYYAQNFLRVRTGQVYGGRYEIMAKLIYSVACKGHSSVRR